MIAVKDLKNNCHFCHQVYKHVLFLYPLLLETSGYATWFTAGGAIRIAHYDVITHNL